MHSALEDLFLFGLCILINVCFSAYFSDLVCPPCSLVVRNQLSQIRSVQRAC